MMRPSDVGKYLYSSLTKRDKIAFITAWIVGFIAHLRIFMQDIPNHDGMDSIYFDQNMITSGRWFLSTVAGISSDFTLPWLIGALSLLYLSITAVILCRFYQLKHSYSAVIVSGLVVVYPTLASNFAYIFTADAYAFAILLSVLAVYLVEYRKKGFIVGGVLLGFSLGIYQSYLAIAMVLSIVGVSKILLAKTQLKEKRMGTYRYLGMGGIGGIVYMVMLQLLLWIQNTKLSGYQGIGAEVSTGWYEKISFVYRDFVSYSLKGNVLLPSNIMLLSFGILLLIGMVAFYYIIKEKKIGKSIVVYIYGVALIMIVPICFNVVLILSPNVTYHSLMRYHWVLLPMTAVALIDSGSSYIRDIKKQAVMQWIALFIGIIMISQYTITTHIAYFNLEKMYEKTYSYTLRLLEQMEETPGYYHGMDVAMIGVVGDDYLPSTSLTQGITDNLLGVNGDYLFYRADNYQLFIKYYFGVTIELVDIEDMPDIVQEEEYKELNTFPKENSMKVVNGVLYIKLENEE